MVENPEKFDPAKINSFIDNNNCDRSLLISILHDIQGEYNYLPKEALEIVADKLKIPLIQVYSVATFFKAFSLKPKGEHLVHICLGTACHVRNAQDVLMRAEQELGIKSGDTTEDMQFTLETVNCLGACALGPIMVIDGEYYGHMNPARVSNFLGKYIQDEEGVQE
ncbi:MAG: NAD(P)H-dependent oxidoreductase subunit E [Thermoplasmata archaeon]|nr:NAD(P)H-dependent oxidoreductase subunit E [Thermoplasmata archaeon]